MPQKTQADFRPRSAIPRNAFLAILAALTLAACQKNDPAAELAAQQAQVTAALNAANLQLANGQTAQALAALQSLHAQNPNRADITENLALALAHAGQLAQAAAFFTQAATSDPSRRALFIYAAALDTTAGNHPAAVQQYQAYLTYFPHDAPAFRSLARELRALNQTQPALNAYHQSLPYTPGNLPSPADALAIAQLFDLLDNSAQADSWYRETLALQPDDPTANLARLGLLRLAVQQNDWPAAQHLIGDLDAAPGGANALDSSPLASARARVQLWIAVHQAANPAASSSPSVASVPSSPTTLAANTTAGPDNTDTPAIEPQTENQKPETPPPPPDPLLAAAHQAQAEGRFPDAIRAYWKVLSKDDSSPDTWLALAQSYNALKQYSDAANTAQEAIRRAPTNPTYTLFYLQIVQATQTPSDYQSAVSAACQQFPNNADLALALAAAFQKAGDNHDATTVLTDFLQRNPADPRHADLQSALADLANTPAKSP
ncbi:MAG: tetratricopeptide repeat protein [Opitutales bacterium]